MSLIFNCAVDSQPARMRFRWVGKFPLDATRNFQLESSTVQVVGADAQPLKGWECTSLLPVSPPATSEETAYAYDVELSPGTSDAFTPVAQESLECVIAARKPGGGRPDRAEARAVVDYGQDPVVRAIQGLGNQLTNQVSQGFTGARDGLQQLTNQVSQGFSEAGGSLQQLSGEVSQGFTEAGDSLQQLTSYPFPVSDGLVPATADGGGGYTSNAGAVIDAQMRSVLGRTPGRGGVAGTLAALDRTFSLVEVDGVETWVPQQPYAVQGDLGGVTGEQASLARLGASVAQEVMPLVANLSPLVLEANVPLDKVEAARAIFSSTFPLLNAELARSAGPRQHRARGLLSDLLTQLDLLGSLLGMYAGSQNGASTMLSRGNVITADDEQNYTNFVIALNRLQLLRDQFEQLYGTGAPRTIPLPPTDRGTLVFVLQRALDATDEAADAVGAAFDSVNLGEDERGLILLDPTNPRSDTIADALELANELHLEAGALLQDGGTLGAATIASRASAVLQEVLMLDLDGSARPAKWPLGVANPRVQVAVGVLEDRLGDVIENANQLAPANAQA